MCTACVQDHEKFQSVAEEAPLLFSRELQMGEEKKALPMKLGEAVAKGIIANQTLGYFIGRTFTFLKRVGLNPEVCAYSFKHAVSFAAAPQAPTTPQIEPSMLQATYRQNKRW